MVIKGQIKTLYKHMQSKKIKELDITAITQSLLSLGRDDTV